MPVEVNAPSAAEQAFVLPDTASVDDIDLREEVSDALKRLPEATKRYIADLFPIAKWIPVSLDGQISQSMRARPVKLAPTVVDQHELFCLTFFVSQTTSL